MLKRILLFLSFLLCFCLISKGNSEYEVSFINSGVTKFEKKEYSAGTVLSVQFNTLSDINGIKIYTCRSSTDKDALKLRLFSYESDYYEATSKTPARETDIDTYKKDSYIEWNFDTLPKGEYILTMQNQESTMSYRKYSLKNRLVQIYDNNYYDTGSIDILLMVNDHMPEPLGNIHLFEMKLMTAPPETRYSEEDPVTYLDIQPSTWTYVDALGRTSPMYSDTGDKSDGRCVGIFYWTWHGELSKSSQAKNITEIMEKYPEARLDYNHKAWGGYSGYHFWNEPLYGYYSSMDEYVLRKHAELLADAGIDFIAFDCTNGSYTWKDSYMTILKVFSKAKEDGVKVPKITFMSNFAPVDSTLTFLEEVYRDLYKQQLYKDLWFYLDGKPLMWAFPSVLDESNDMDKEIKEFFTFRYPCADSIWPADPVYSWDWAGYYPNVGRGVKIDGRYEQMAISIAVNANGPMNNPDAWGRSYTKSNYTQIYSYGGKTINVNSNMPDSMLYGIFIQEQWDYVIEQDPRFLFITGWNEWVAMRHEEWGGYENAFPDEFDDEYSRDIEPSKGKLKDNYYYQLVSNIRRYKGCVEPDKYEDKHSIDIQGDMSQWDNINAIYNHYTNNTPKRNQVGYGSIVYKSDTMRNDISSARIAYDDSYVYFYVETVDDITPYTDENWMRLYIDCDYTGISDNWEGFELIINRISPDTKFCTLEKSTGGYSWEKLADVEYSLSGNKMMMAVPMQYIPYSDEGYPVFSFKWSDNNNTDGDIFSLYTDGDAAPGGRFAFGFNIGYANEMSKRSIVLYIVVIIAITATVVVSIVMISKYRRMEKNS